MEDARIIRMFQERDEAAIKELSSKYNQYCFKIAWNVLYNREDSEECVNDTWFSVWSYIPPRKPAVLSAFVGKITRGLAIDTLRRKYAAKRPDLHMSDIELETRALNSIAVNTLDDVIAKRELERNINQFLRSLPKADCDIFLRRYWYMDSLKEIAERHGKSVGSIKSNLYRSRKKLYRILKEEGSVSCIKTDMNF
ncbi:MAG: sigma-70 family RNA polymerase sigma factor [Eubacteriales bacterium]|nr:sigma-70 family RNA polymerase sigma factor [Eubacteriales bacterium]